MAKAVEVEKEEEQLVNCLRKEKVCVRYVPRQSHMVTDPKHILYGGMAEDAVKTFVVPKLTTGTYVNVLTNKEMAFLENILGMDKGALSVYKKQDNFWSDANPQGINKVRLRKQDNYLDLSIPEDYIRYKILLANKDFVHFRHLKIDQRLHINMLSLKGMTKSALQRKTWILQKSATWSLVRLRIILKPS